jgi:elongator complex protein 3
MLDMGATRVEIGVQTLSDEILKRVERGHDVEASANASKMIRDSGLKVAYHIMPGLPGATPERDLDTFRQLFSDRRFRPDMLKIYPTVVIENTRLYEWWKNGSYTPYGREIMIDLLAEAVSEMPRYVRIQRMQRDIPLHQIRAGFDRGNLRELVQQRINVRRLKDSTIRFREVGHYEIRTRGRLNPAALSLVRMDYEASDGEEALLSFEDTEADVILGFLRLRVPSSDAHRPEITEKPSAIVRELRVYGQMVELGQRKPDAWQHLGIGERLMKEAEEIARDEFHAERLLVNSGIGVKEYYRNLGFSDLGPYVAKDLSG